MIRDRAACLSALVLLCCLLTSCGGGSERGSGSGSGGGSGTTPPSNLVYKQSTINAADEFPLTPDTPTVTGSVSSFSVAPGLPAGMTLNAVTGAISGTPSAVTAQANYTVTASNAGGSTTAVLQIAITLTAPANLVYPQTTINATTGVAVQPDVPSVEGVVTSYSVSPALPAGLQLDSTTGQITGTPTSAATQSTYVVTGSNSAGSTTASIQITVSLAAPSNLVYPQTTISGTTGTAISPDVPTVTGLVTGFSVSPMLPAGLTLNTSSGAISGTPTAASATASYTVTASNSAGSTTAALQITVTLSPPSNLVYPQTTINATVGTAIATETPTVSGAVTGYSVSPALPAGLALNTSTGAISGTPTVASSTASYTVTAQNSAGSTTATLQITVTQEAAPSNLVYPQTAIHAAIGDPIVTDTPTVSGTVTGYFVSPALPTGLSLDPTSGAISGAPTVASAQATYTVTAQNAGGSTTAQVTITVATSPGVLYQGGHQTTITSMHSNSSRLLSSDNFKVWILWDFSSGDIVAQGTGTTQANLEGQIFAVNNNSAADVEVRSAQDGNLIFTVPGISLFVIPADGSYICTYNSSGLTVWSPSGSAEVVRSGDYSKATIFAATGQVQVAQGPAGQNVIETIDVAAGTSTASPTFLGTFQFWFADGSNFVTTFGNEYWVYSNAGVQAAGGTYPQSVSSWGGGVGNWIWTSSYSQCCQGSFAVFAIGATTPTEVFQTYSSGTYIQVGSTIAALGQGYPELGIVDLSGATPTLTQYTLATTELWLSAYTKNASGEWAVGNEHGVVMDATNLSSPVYFDYGQVLGLAAGGNTAAVATASGRILIYDIASAQLTGTINFLASDMQMSSDGTVLAAEADSVDSEFAPDRTLNIYSLPSLSVVQTYPTTYTEGGGTYLRDFVLSDSGSILGQSLADEATVGLQQVTGVSGAPLIWSETEDSLPVFLSPDGTIIGALDGFGGVNGGTSIVENGTPMRGNVYPTVGFIDNNTLLVETATNYGGTYEFLGYAISDLSGNLISSLPLNTIPDILDYQLNATGMEIARPQFPTTSTMYWGLTGAIYSLTTGQVIWQGPPSGPGLASMTGSYLVYYTGTEVEVLPNPLN